MGELELPKEYVKLGQWLEEQKVQVVCWDFDETAMLVHTGGYINETSLTNLQQRVNDLSHQISPYFRSFTRYLQLKHPTIKHAIVSFADNFSRSTNPNNTVNPNTIGGTELICSVLHKGFSWPRPAFHIVSFYPDVANNLKQFNHKVPNNKTLHMQLVAKHFNIQQPSAMLLIDNDHNNCMTAASLGYHAWFVKKTSRF